MKILEQENKKSKWINITVISIIVLSTIGFITYIDFKRSKDADVYHALALDAIINRDYSKAEKLLGAAIRKKKKAVYFYDAYRLVLAENKYYEASIFIDKAVRLEPKNPAYLTRAAAIQANLEAYSKAIEYIQRAIKLAPKTPNYQLDLANYFYYNNEIENAIKILESLTEKYPQYSPAWNNLALYHSYNKDPEKSYEVWKQATQANPDDAYSFYMLGSVCEKTKKNSEAIAAYRKSIELSPYDNAKRAYEKIVSLSGKEDPQLLAQILGTSTINIPFISRGRTIFIKAAFMGYPGTFLVDTGASDSIIFQSFLSKHKLKIDSYGFEKEYITAGSSIIQVPVVYGKFQIGPYEIHNVATAIIDNKLTSASDGIIGQNILSKFHVQINNEAHTLSLR